MFSLWGGGISAVDLDGFLKTFHAINLDHYPCNECHQLKSSLSWYILHAYFPPPNYYHCKYEATSRSQYLIISKLI